MRLFLDLTKSGIICFVLISGAAGYALSQPFNDPFELGHFLLTLGALYFLSAGGFALNQAQEHKIDKRMPRTENRPIPSGRVSRLQACVLGFGFVIIGLFCSWLLSPLVLALGFATVVLYNVLYTLYWKKRWAFGAVPGAIPGAMPFVIGYAANTSQLARPELVYGFLIMFLWQMPHFWALAIRFKDDYSRGGIPVLPTMIGTNRTLYHIGLYVFAYVALAVAAPWFTTARIFYAILVVPFAFKVLYEFFKFYNAEAKSKWLSFFLWTNASVLIFLLAPVIDRWYGFFIR